MESIQVELIELATAVIVALVGFITKKVTTYLNNKGMVDKIQSNKELVKIAVTAVEQTYQHLHGEQKFNMAKIELAKLLKEKKIKISEKEIDLLIESAVKEMNDTVKEVIKEKK